MPTNVLVTGPFGRVGPALLRHLAPRDDYHLTCLDVREPPDGVGEELAADGVDLATDVDTVTADVRDAAAVRAAVEDQDAVVHLAVHPDLGRHRTETGWSEDMAGELEAHVNVFSAAVEADVERVVLASTHQLTEAYEQEAEDPRDPRFTIDHETPVRPASQYALSKAWAEDYGRFCAEVHDLRVYALRLGWVMVGGAEHPYAAAEAAAERGEVERGSPDYEAMADRPIWLSGRDCAQLVECCLRNETVEFDVFWGASDNTGGWLDVDRARTLLGYEPQDDVAAWEGPPG